MNILPPDSKPFGLTLGEWSIHWWTWILNLPKKVNPALDPTGQNAFIGQSDDNIFFLCQTIEGTKPQPTRKISIRRGTSIFMPILNWISNFYEDGTTEEELIQTAKRKIDAVGFLELYFNGKRLSELEKYRFTSKFFEVKLPKDNILDVPPGLAKVVSDGYWIFTEPITTNIFMSSFGACSEGLTKIGVEYSITVI